MPDGGGVALAAAAWLVAGALAVALGGAAFGFLAHWRARAALARRRALEAAVEEFCSALRDRLVFERERLAQRGGRADASGQPLARQGEASQRGGARSGQRA